MPVRRHRAAGMHVRIDQRTQRPGAFEPRIEVETQLARQRQVGTLAGGGDDPVDRPDPAPAFGRLAFDDRFARCSPCGAPVMEKPVTSVTRPLSTSSLTSCAKLAARRQLIGVATAIDPREIGAPRRPDERGLRLGLREPRQLEQRVAGRMARRRRRASFCRRRYFGRDRGYPGCRRRSGREARLRPRPADRSRRADSASSRCRRHR